MIVFIFCWFVYQADAATRECLHKNDCLINGNLECRDGKCACVRGVCEFRECLRNQHCAELYKEGGPYRCVENKCMPVECTKNNHCYTCKYDRPHMCDKWSNICVEVKCAQHRDCGEKGRCIRSTSWSPISLPFCEYVECDRNRHCDANQICKKNKCHTVECLSNVYCAFDEICENNKCVPSPLVNTKE
ncbi:Oidioi.mRNA.OKI2018_I69.chr2.g8271.t1.cds [Oikopleura dioica]|uniref:Oidioi.mRNA.OKI2018_I69.chr2.g8271.t1.cds n=1 Tax=Oikopleura dioica TaxID=34765 RepID=A0ABN7TD76_OIKDI|nr:Oidioi.mRNA.OKI2018_I69.chr2.g8271.t1.cds [Oikopleura dioica]